MTVVAVGGGGVDMLDSWANYTEAKAKISMHLQVF